VVYSPNSLLQRLALVLLLSLAATAPARAAEIGALRSCARRTTPASSSIFPRRCSTA